MALNTSKCNHLTPLPFKGLTVAYMCTCTCAVVSSCSAVNCAI